MVSVAAPAISQMHSALIAPTRWQWLLGYGAFDRWHERQRRWQRSPGYCGLTCPVWSWSRVAEYRSKTAASSGRNTVDRQTQNIRQTLYRNNVVEWTGCQVHRWRTSQGQTSLCSWVADTTVWIEVDTVGNRKTTLQPSASMSQAPCTLRRTTVAWSSDWPTFHPPSHLAATLETWTTKRRWIVQSAKKKEQSEWRVLPQSQLM